MESRSQYSSPFLRSSLKSWKILLKERKVMSLAGQINKNRIHAMLLLNFQNGHFSAVVD